jgi:oligoendopeptidase F
MSVEFSNAYQEVLLENLDSILRQNFMFQTKLKMFENEANGRAELQAKLEDVTAKYKEALENVDRAEQYKSQAQSNDAIVQEKNRIQSALNDTMKKVSAIQKSLDAVKYELEDEKRLHSELKEYVSKLESVVPATKLKKINTVKVEEPKPDDSAPVDLFNIKVEDGSSF